MRKTLKKGDLDYDIVNDYWQLVKEYNIPDSTDKYWIELANAISKFCKKYRNSDYVRGMAENFLKSRENMFKKMGRS